MEQKPSIGRIVHYQPGNAREPIEPSAGMITKIYDDGECSLTIFNEGIEHKTKAPYSETPKPGCWNWPPRV